VLETGLYEKIVVDDGEVWLCVSPGGSQADVAPCKIQVRKVTFDDGPATKVSVSNKEPLFLLKGAAAVKPGKVASLFTENDNAPDTITVVLQGKKYVIRRTQGTRKSDGWRFERLSLHLGGRQMVLGDCPARDGIRPLWAGDLDGDGRLDLYVRVEHHGGWVEQILFLSSADSTGKALTAQAAKLLVQKLE
jgi:hypothetical protein